MKLLVIGLGHIGGSFAKTLKAVLPEVYVYGVDGNAAHGVAAKEAGWIDEVTTLEVGVPLAEVVVMAIPVDPLKQVLPMVLDLVGAEAMVFDAGSTKAAICQAVAGHPNRAQFVAAHPIAGTENSGPAAAMDNLLQGKRMILCETNHSADWAVDRMVAICEALQMDVLYMTPEEHDEHLAYISHLSHLTSFSLALSVLRAEKYEDKIFHFAGSGFASTARLGKSSPEMWSSIFLENKKPLLQVLDTYTEILNHFREAIVQDDVEALHRYMSEANDIRRILEGKGNPPVE